MTFEFDGNGMLVIRPGAAEEFQKHQAAARKRNRKDRTGIFLKCPNCGYIWERQTRKMQSEMICHNCWKTVSPKAAEEGEIQ